MLQNIVEPNIGKKLSSNQWPVILGAGFYTTYRGERVLVLITFNATFLLLRRSYEKICTSFLNDAKSLTTYGCVLWCSQMHGRRKNFFQGKAKVCFSRRS